MVVGDDDDDDVVDVVVDDVRCLPTLALILCSFACVTFIWITKRGHMERCQW